MIDFLPLASSSAGCCYHLTCGSHPGLLLDAGVSYSAIQQALDFKVSGLAGALITHAHGDHCKAVFDLMSAGVDVYASTEAWLEMRPRGENRSCRHRMNALEAKEEETIGPWTVLPFEAVHDSPGTLGFMIESPEGDRLLYLTDTAYSRFKFEGLTHIAVEANFSQEIMRENVLAGAIDRTRFSRTSHNHMSIERLLELLKKLDISNVQWIYLLHLSDTNSDAEAFRTAVERATGKPVYIAAKNAAAGVKN